MDDVVICPNCGEANPTDLPFCQHCQWRLHSLIEESGVQSDADSTTAPVETLGPQDGSESVPDWLMNTSEYGNSDALDSGHPGESRRGDSVHTDDLLAGLNPQSEAEPEEIPDWVARIMGISQREVAPGAASDAPTRIPDAPQSVSSSLRDSKESNESSPQAWESAMGPTDSAAERGLGPVQQVDELAEQASGTDDNEINEWLRQLDASAAKQETDSRPHRMKSAQDVPSWVDGMLGVPATTPQGPGGQEDTLPEWLVEPARSHGTDSISWPTPALDPSDAVAAAGTPDRLAADPTTMAAAKPQQAALEPTEVVPPFPSEEIDGLDVDAVLASMQMPDWLADVERGQAASSDASQSLGDEEPIAPGNLPSWVEAMRPVDSDAPARKTESTDARSQARGPLLGLHGVLPAIPGAASPSSRPRSHSIRLETSEQHLAHARLLEELLAAEMQAAPLRGIPQSGPHDLLRWVIGALMVILIGGALLSGSRVFPLPAAVPIESNAAIQAVQSIQPDAAVLAVFDYEPATAGEMEATASSLMDHLLLLKHPRLALISTSATGSALAERFLSGTLADRVYVRGTQFVNLGFLPGGLAGVRFFAEDPVAAVPLGAASDRVWDSTVLIGTRHLHDFAAIILITDGLESGRVWIEQTQDARGSSHMIVVSSAQAGPMLLPYFNSGQVQGLVAGLNGAAGPELSNSGLPGFVRHYWDAYSLGLYAAALLIVAGAAWHVSMAARGRQQDLT